ncbi:hypothetical protein ACJJTC_016586 [Scirpophaga incertulas]
MRRTILQDHSLVSIEQASRGTFRCLCQSWIRAHATAMQTDAITSYYTQGLTPVLWALQVVNALPYPLLARTEWFALNDHENPDDIKVASFLRNEGLVTISSQVKKIILLVSAPQKRIRIGGAEVPVTGVARNGDVPPIMPMDARDLIVGCLDSLMSHPVSLTELFNRWAVARVSSQSIDWAEIDTYLRVVALK